MKYEEALEIVEKEFETRYVDEDCRALRINLTYDGYSGLYIVVFDKDGEAFLSDEGETKNVFWKYVNEAEWSSLCAENGFVFTRHMSIERRFISMKDVHDFIDFLLIISEKYNPILSEPEKSIGGNWEV